VGQWANSVIGELKQKFETYAENYRAQAEQALGGREITKDELDGLQENLARLQSSAEPRAEAREAECASLADARRETSKTE
jgi:hypothetical protein